MIRFLTFCLWILATFFSRVISAVNTFFDTLSTMLMMIERVLQYRLSHRPDCRQWCWRTLPTDTTAEPTEEPQLYLSRMTGRLWRRTNVRVASPSLARRCRLSLSLHARIAIRKRNIMTLTSNNVITEVPFDVGPGGDLFFFSPFSSSSSR